MDPGPVRQVDESLIRRLDRWLLLSNTQTAYGAAQAVKVSTCSKNMVVIPPFRLSVYNAIPPPPPLQQISVDTHNLVEAIVDLFRHPYILQPTETRGN